MLIQLGRNMELRDELLALRENTAQAYGHAEAFKAQWQEIDKAQAQLYQVSVTPAMEASNWRRRVRGRSGDRVRDGWEGLAYTGTRPSPD